MLRIEGRTIKIHRGDAGTITYKIPTGDTYYTFKVGDIIRLSIFEKNSDYSTTLKEIEVTMAEESTQVSIPINQNDSIIGEPTSKPIEYNYEISLNGTNTTTGYDDEEGGAIFMVLPAKGVDI